MLGDPDSSRALGRKSDPEGHGRNKRWQGDSAKDHFSSLSAAKIIRNESHQELRKALIDTIVPLKLTGECTVKVDNATGFLPLIERKDPELSKLKIVAGGNILKYKTCVYT